MIAQLTGDFYCPKSSISTQTDSLIRSVRTLVDNKDLTKSIASIEHTTADLAVSSSQLKE